MGTIQSSINSMINNAASLGTVAKAIKEAGEIKEELKGTKAATEEQTKLQKEAAEKQKQIEKDEEKEKEYSDALMRPFYEGLTQLTGAKDAEKLSQAMVFLDNKKNIMMNQRSMTKRLLNQYKEGTPEWNAIEKAGQLRKEENLKDTQAYIDALIKSHKKGGVSASKSAQNMFNRTKNANDLLTGKSIEIPNRNKSKGGK